MATGDTSTSNCSSRTNFNFDALEKLRCSKISAEKRITMYKFVGLCGTELVRGRRYEDIELVIVGSRGEGIYNSFENDLDILYIQNTVKCFGDFQRPLEMDKSSHSVLFQLDLENVPPGYSRLRLISFENIKKWPRNNSEFLTNLKYALIQRNGHRYLRNDQPLTSTLRNDRNGCIRQQSVFYDTTGPARTYQCVMPFCSEMHFSVDCVLAFNCEYPSVIDEWYKRERKFSWPNKDLIEKVKGLEVYVVPAGCKGSTDEELQWRISLTLQEQALVHSFNDTQIKLYTALKMLMKHELKTVCDNITSYIAKNCIFWTFENNEISDFRKDVFDCNLLNILRFLKSCINWKYLRNYLNPSINMLQNKITELEKVKLIQRLDLLINFDCGHTSLLRCPLVNEMSFFSTEEINQRIVFIDLVEQLVMSAVCVTAAHPKLEYLIFGNVLTPINFYKIAQKQLFPLIRKYNPLGLFGRLDAISNEEILSILLNGIANGYHQIK